MGQQESRPEVKSDITPGKPEMSITDLFGALGINSSTIVEIVKRRQKAGNPVTREELTQSVPPRRRFPVLDALEHAIGKFIRSDAKGRYISREGSVEEQVTHDARDTVFVIRREPESGPIVGPMTIKDLAELAGFDPEWHRRRHLKVLLDLIARLRGGT